MHELINRLVHSSQENNTNNSNFWMKERNRIRNVTILYFLICQVYQCDSYTDQM